MQSCSYTATTRQVDAPLRGLLHDVRCELYRAACCASVRWIHSGLLVVLNATGGRTHTLRLRDSWIWRQWGRLSDERRIEVLKPSQALCQCCL